jgi:23S rRNA (adenine2503-C2)-methyltransferase
MTGRDGLLRQVDSGEMVAQVVLARQRRTVSRSFSWAWASRRTTWTTCWKPSTLGTYGGIGHKNLVFSTVGDYRVFERLPQQRVARPWPFHCTPPVRNCAPNCCPRPHPSRRRTGRTGRNLRPTTGYPIQYQWTLIDGINDSEAEMDGIVRLLSGKYALMNLIPTTPRRRSITGGRRWKVTALTRYLHARGIRTTVRNSAGQDVDGGCGQLRARNLERTGSRPQKSPCTQQVKTLSGLSQPESRGSCRSAWPGSRPHRPGESRKSRHPPD